MKACFTRRFVMFVAALAITGAGPASAGLMYGVSFASTEGSILYQVDPQSGLASNPRPTGLDHVVGIAFGSDGTLYGLTNATTPTHPNTLVRINSTTGSAQVVGSTGLSDIVEGDLAFDRTTGSLYGMYHLTGGQRKLFTVNASTGAATALPDSLAGDPSAMAFDAAGNLYVIDTALAKLHTVNKATGATLTTLSLSRSLGAVAGMAVDPATGVFYVADGDSGGTDHLYTLDPTTGLLTDIGPTGLANGLAGLAIVPEPASAVLLSAGAWWFGRRRSRA